MCDFTVVTFFTTNFEPFVGGLQDDCRRLEYPLHAEHVTENFGELIQAFDFKISFIRDMVRRFDKILWLDVECRLVKRLPNEWAAPLISTYETARSSGFSSGVLMLDRTHLQLIDLWLKYAHKYPQYPDDFVLDFLANTITLDFMTVLFEFYDRQTTHPIARGLWKNDDTIIQHPTINRWPEPMKYRTVFSGKERKRRSIRESVSRQRKGIYYRNFSGDFQIVDDTMRAGREQEFHYAGWVFDAESKLYAPELYWPDYADNFTSKPRSFETSRENFLKKPKGVTYRQAAIRKMRLDAGDARSFAPLRVSPHKSIFDRVFAFLGPRKQTAETGGGEGTIRRETL